MKVVYYFNTLLAVTIDRLCNLVTLLLFTWCIDLS
jgi:hypothetical protein